MTLITVRRAQLFRPEEGRVERGRDPVRDAGRRGAPVRRRRRRVNIHNINISNNHTNNFDNNIY